MADDFESFLQDNKGSAQAPSPLASQPEAPAQQATDPFEAFLRDQKAASDAANVRAAQAQVIGTQDVPADTAGRAAQVGRQIGLPQGAVETDLPRYEAQAKAQQGAAALAGNPKLASAHFTASTVYHGRHNMPHFGPQSDLGEFEAFVTVHLDDEEIASVVNYVRSHFGNHYADELTAKDIAALHAEPQSPATP